MVNKSINVAVMLPVTVPVILTSLQIPTLRGTKATGSLHGRALLPPCEGQAASRGPQPKPRLQGPLCTPQLGGQPKESHGDLPGKHQHLRRYDRYSPTPSGSDPITSPPGKESEAALAFGETEKRLSQEGSVELPEQPEVGRGKKKTQKTRSPQ